MAQSGQRKCLCCQLFFDVDRRIGERQRYCPKPDCQRASKAASQAAWLAKPHNQDYVRDPVHVARVQAWRAQHPGYSRAKRRDPRKHSVNPLLWIEPGVCNRDGVLIGEVFR